MPRLSQAKARERVNLKITYYGLKILLIIHTNYMAVYLDNMKGWNFVHAIIFLFDDFRIRKFQRIFILVYQDSPKEPPKQ